MTKFMALAFALMLMMVSGATGQTDASDTDTQAKQALEKFFAAVISGRQERVMAVLAPEFQIVRADGSSYDAKTYPVSVLPSISRMPTIRNLVVTSADDIIVANYLLDIKGSRDGAIVKSGMIRLTVLRKAGEDWLVVAHGNFAQLGR